MVGGQQSHSDWKGKKCNLSGIIICQVDSRWTQVRMCYRWIQVMMHILKTISRSHNNSRSCIPIKMFHLFNWKQKRTANPREQQMEKYWLKWSLEMVCWTERITMQMLKKCPIWSIFKHHHSVERLILLTEANQIHKVLMVDPWQCINLKSRVNYLILKVKLKIRIWNAFLLMAMI